MRRQDIQLLALARQGDAPARREVGRRYLLGADGFPRHVGSGLDYLAGGHDDADAARIIAESLPLDELLQHGQLPALERAARAGSVVARARLDAWLALRDGRVPAQSLLAEAPAALWQAVALRAARDALAEAPLAQATRCVQAALTLAPDGDDPDAELAALVVDLVKRAEGEGRALQGLSPRALLASLEQLGAQGDSAAAYALGRALSGIACTAFGADVFADSQNMRRGAAFLLRAADGGQDEAWLHLYRLHADHRLSVANPQMARFFLEKAAARGLVEAQRKLGALMLREATALQESEQAIHWLHQAAAQGDAPARELLDSLVLPVDGDDDDARSAIEQVRRSDPWLAIRLQLARMFGLTRLEALSVDPSEGLRAWGLVVGRNPFITQARLAAPRAVPALSAAAHEAARQAASFFRQAASARSAEGDLRQRSARQRRIFERLGLDDALFFADATAMTLEALRLGPKWAFRARQPLRLALAA